MSQEKNHRNEEQASRSQDRSQALVEKLIRLADAGADLPLGGADRVKDAVRPLWQAEVRLKAQRRRKSIFIGGLAVAAGIILAVAVMSNLKHGVSPAAMPVAQLEGVVGELEISPFGGVPLRVGEGHRGLDVLPGTWLHAGTGVKAALRLAGGQSLRLDSSTRLQLVSAGMMTLESGAVYIDSQGQEGVGVAVLTTFGTARDIGTQFEVRHKGERLLIRVREGVVELENNTGIFAVNSGAEVSVATDGSRSTRSISPFDPVWRWVQEVAPVVEIEGRSVTATLGWVSRETGLEVEFSDPELEAFADITILHGSAEGLTPAEVPALVLPGCGLEVVRQPGMLVIQRMQVEHTDPSAP